MKKKPATESPPTQLEMPEQELLSELGRTFNGTVGPWGERLIALYRALTICETAMDGIKLMPDELSPDSVLMRRVAEKLIAAREEAGNLVLSHLILRTEEIALTERNDQ
jgi:hypothetical protein